MKPKIEIILASVREGRWGEKVARWVHSVGAARPDLEATLLDLKDWPLPTYTLALPPMRAESTYTDPLARAWVARIAAADGFVVVTPEYNHGYPPSLKNVLDWAYTPWNAKPIAFASYGGAGGGIRAVQQLRQVAIELQMAPIRNEVNIPMVFTALGDDGAPKDAGVARRATAMFDQLAWWADALKNARERRPSAVA